MPRRSLDFWGFLGARGAFLTSDSLVGVLGGYGIFFLNCKAFICRLKITEYFSRIFLKSFFLKTCCHAKVCTTSATNPAYPCTTHKIYTLVTQRALVRAPMAIATLLAAFKLAGPTLKLIFGRPATVSTYPGLASNGQNVFNSNSSPLVKFSYIKNEKI